MIVSGDNEYVIEFITEAMSPSQDFDTVKTAQKSRSVIYESRNRYQRDEKSRIQSQTR